MSSARIGYGWRKRSPRTRSTGREGRSVQEARLTEKAIEKMTVEIHTPIRAECLLPADEGWERPRGAEVQEVLRRTGLSGRAVARVLGLSEHGGRQVRRWVSEDAPITYTAWAILCDMAGLGRIWRGKTLEMGLSSVDESAPDDE